MNKFFMPIKSVMVAIFITTNKHFNNAFDAFNNNKNNNNNNNNNNMLFFFSKIKACLGMSIILFKSVPRNS